MPPACWGSQCRSGRSPRSSFRFTLQFRRPEHPGLPSDCSNAAQVPQAGRTGATALFGTPVPARPNPADVTGQSATGVDGPQTTAAAIGRGGGDERGRGVPGRRGYFADIRVAEVSPSNHDLATCKNTSQYFTGAICNSWPSVAKMWPRRPALWVVRPRLHKLNRRASTVEQRAGERTPDNGGQPGSTVEVGVRR